MKSFIIPACMLLLATGISSGREWTSTDGKKLEGEFISLADGKVTLKRPNGQIIVVPMERLSEDDRDWAELQKSEPAPDTPVKTVEGPFAPLISGQWELSEGEGQKFAFYGPISVNGDRKYPLVVVLHGKSGNTNNGDQVSGWMKSFTTPENLTERPCYLLAPMSAQPQSGEGMGWRDGEAARIVKLIKSMVKNLNVDPARIYIAGHSMGGAGTCNVMAEEPRLFAAAIPVAGVSLDAAKDLSRKPVWVFHAVDDTLVKVDGAREFADVMKRNKNFKYTESETGGHGVVDQVFKNPETHIWLFSQTL